MGVRRNVIQFERNVSNGGITQIEKCQDKSAQRIHSSPGAGNVLISTGVAKDSSPGGGAKYLSPVVDKVFIIRGPSKYS